MIHLQDKISGYILDKQQQDIVLDSSQNLLVVAGAGSGKTLTILGKIYYLVKYKKILPEEILCISFTRASSSSLEQKINKDLSLNVPVYTFHKLALEILKQCSKEYKITSVDTLELIINEFFTIDILKFPKHMKCFLEYFGIYVKENIKQQYLNFYCSAKNKIKVFCNLIFTFISLFKSNSYVLSDFIKFLKKSRLTFSYLQYRKEKIFLIFTLNIFLKYQSYLQENNEIDFNDMITLATEYVNKNEFNKDYKYIIIDEYQDTSYVRFQLIKSILRKIPAKLMVVGDDFQSIYRFTGCDISLFLNFSRYFKDAKIKKIENTYRNSQELIEVAGTFVMCNRSQIPKKLSANKHINKPVKIYYYENIKQDFLTFLITLYKQKFYKIMIVGRNNNDIKKLLPNECKLDTNGKIFIEKMPDLQIYYLTAHKSKGLEEENVIIINLIKDKLGFPNDILDDKILRFVSLKKEKYKYAEERRLFYVALTRTKNFVYLYVPRNNISPFVKELLKKNKDFIEVIT